MSWTDSKVEVNGNNPQVSGGPVSASGSSTLLSVYVGHDGQNLWYSYAEPSFTWQGNQPIKDPKSGGNVTSGGRPALCYVSDNGYFLLVIPGKREFQTWKYPFGNWSLVGSYSDITELQFNDPALGDVGDRTHLLICDNLGNLWWYSMDHSGGGWGGQQRVASGTTPSITSIGNTLHGLYWDTDQKAFIKLTLPPGASSWQQNRIFFQGPTPKQGAAISSLNSQLYIVYTAEGNSLQYATLNADFSSGPSQPMPAKTDAAPTVTAFQNSLVVLHQGESSQNLWFAVSV